MMCVYPRQAIKWNRSPDSFHAWKSTSTENLPSVPDETVEPALAPPAPVRPREIGGRGGLDPTRYGDWEKDGRCIDF